MGTRRGLQTAIALLIAATQVGPVRADPLISGELAQDAIAIEVGVIGNMGQSEYAFQGGGTTPSVQGIVIRDRNGWTGRAVIAVVIALMGKFGATGDQHFEHTYVEVDRDYEPGYVKVTTTTVTNTIHLASREELDAATSSVIAGLFNVRHSDFELDLYSRNWLGVGDSDGFKMNALVGGGAKTAIEIGLGVGSVRSYVQNEGMATRINYSYFGIPFRVSKVMGPVRVAATYEWNWLGYGGDDKFSKDKEGMYQAHNGSSPLHLDASGVILGRVSVTAGITAQRFYHPDQVGAHASVGLRF